ncbi:hypothetical protein [Streptomyces sp. Y1]|uniref:DUF4034 domain-containing protein n=1 Tax=Streptomyces sp. Y1 TaxID=3238634 RepID=A0AB39TGP5_9ACTN
MALFRRRSGEDGAQDRAGWRGLFGRRAVEGPAAAGRPRLDPVLGDEHARLLVRQAAAGDWAALRPALADHTGDADGTELTRLTAMVAEQSGVEEWTVRALADAPDDTLALLLSGARHVNWGWEARSKAQAKYVSEEQWKTFHQRLDVAEAQLLEVAEREPTWLAPWYFLQISARGISLGPDVATCRFEAAVRRSPGHPASHRQRLQQLCQKWGGSHEEMHAFARTAMLAAPEGSPLGELVALAHLEHWLSLSDGEDQDYLSSPAVVASLQEAAFRSVLHPDFVPARGWQGSFNTFAMAFSMADQPKTARLLFDALDGMVTEAPWHYLSGDPVKAFTRHRDRCAAAY